MRILVLCTGNSCRSQMAEGFFRSLGGEQITVRSAGLLPKGVNPWAIRVMQEIDIDISGHTSNHLSDYLQDQFDYIITVCDNAAEQCPVFPGGGERLHWPFPDPHEVDGDEAETLRVFRTVRDQIGAQIRAWLSAAARHSA